MKLHEWTLRHCRFAVLPKIDCGQRHGSAVIGKCLGRVFVPFLYLPVTRRFPYNSRFWRHKYPEFHATALTAPPLSHQCIWLHHAICCYYLLFTFWKKMHMCVVEVSTRCLGSLCLMKCLNLPGRHRSHQLSESNMWATALPPSPLSMISHHWHRPRKHWPRLANCCRVCRKQKWCLPNYFGPIRPNFEPAKGKCQVAKQSHTNVSLPKNSQFHGIQNAWENYHVPLCSFVFWCQGVPSSTGWFCSRNLGQKKVPSTDISLAVKWQGWHSHLEPHIQNKPKVFWCWVSSRHNKPSLIQFYLALTRTQAPGEPG